MNNFDDLEFSQNPDPRAPVVLLLDASSSMLDKRPGETVDPLTALDGALDTLVSELHKDPLAKRRVEVSFVTFGSHVNPATDFVTVDKMVLPRLEPMGATSMGAAINEALDALQERKQTYKANGIQYFRPWVLLITDGVSTDDVTEASRRIKELEEKKGVSFFVVGVDGADMNFLNQLGTRQALPLSGVKFDELFIWLSASQASVSASQPGDKVALPAPSGWADIEA